MAMASVRVRVGLSLKVRVRFRPTASRRPLSPPPSMWPTLALALVLAVALAPPSTQVAARRRAWRELILALYRRAMFIREAKLGALSPQLAEPTPHPHPNSNPNSNFNPNPNSNPNPNP